MATESEVKKIIKSSRSEIEKRVKASISEFIEERKNEVKKGSLDIYGNVINYDPNNWVGEDYVLEKETIKSEDFKVGKDYGTLDVSIPDYLTLDNTNVELSIVDDGYNMHNIYIYYRNNYHEKIDMSQGRYRINNISFLGVDGSDYVLSAREFKIENGETTYITIDHIFNEAKEETVATSSEVVQSAEIPQRRGGSRFIFMMIFFAIVGVAMYFIMKKRKEKDEQY